MESKFDSRVRRKHIKSNFRKEKGNPLHIRYSDCTNHVKSNLRRGISNLRIFDINLATKFEYGGKLNLVAPDPLLVLMIETPHPVHTHSRSSLYI